MTPSNAARWRRTLVLLPLLVLGLAVGWWVWDRYHRALQANQVVRREIARLKESTLAADQARLEAEQAILDKLKRGVPFRMPYSEPQYGGLRRGLPLSERAYPVLADQLTDNRRAVRDSALFGILRLQLSGAEKEAFIQLLLDRLGDPESTHQLVDVLLRLEVDQERLGEALLAAIDRETYDNLGVLAHEIYLFTPLRGNALLPVYVELMGQKEVTEVELVHHGLRRNYVEKEPLLAALQEAIDESGEPEEQTRLAEWLETLQHIDDR